MLSCKLKKINVLYIMILLFVLQACGFSALHSKDGNASVTNNFKSINISPIAFGRFGQILQTRLEDILNPKNESADKKYDLIIKLSNQNVPLAIEQNAEITRYNLVLKAKIKVVDIVSNKIFFQSSSKIIGSYQATASDFAIYTVEDDTMKRAIKEVAEDIKSQLYSKFFVENNK